MSNRITVSEFLVLASPGALRELAGIRERYEADALTREQYIAAMRRVVGPILMFAHMHPEVAAELLGEAVTP